jgi:S1-C subfamily serine protease
MSDPLSLSVIGATIAVEGVKFLYRQADALLDAWKKRRRRGTDVAKDESLDVPLPASPALVSAPKPGGADAARVEEASEALEALATALYPYAEEGQPVPDDSRTLSESVASLRQLLEAIYRQPLTFKGEQRERTGAELDVAQVIDRVKHSTVMGVREASVGDGSRLRVEQDVTEAEGSDITGIGSLVLGTSAPPPRPAADPAIAHDVQDRWSRDTADIARVRRAAAAGELGPVNPAEQLSQREARLRARGLSLEGIVKDDDSLWAQFLAAGTRATAAVALIARTRKDTVMQPLGTGVLISQHLLLTNHHVLPDAEAARGLSALFDYGHDENGSERKELAVPLDVDAGFFADETLDFAVVALSPDPPLGARHPADLIADPGKILLGERVNVIHHANGERARISIRANRLVDQDDDWLRYTSDTRHGSSGSPVFNDQWEMIGLHHGGIPDPGAPPDREAATANEGVRISRIIAKLRVVQLDEPTRALVDAALPAMTAPRPG